MKKGNITIVALIIIIVNLIFLNTNIKLDITRDKIYTLSKGTKNTLNKIEDNLFIDFYYSKELPSQVNATKEYVLAVLKDYASLSDKIKISTIKVDDKKETRNQAISEGITPVRFDIISKEKFEQREGFLGIVLRYQNKKETIGFISDTSSFEYDLTTRIKNIIKDKKDEIYFITDYGALSSYRLPSKISQILSTNYELKSETLKDLYFSTQSQTISLIGPSIQFEEKDLFYLDQIILRGTRLFIALDTKYTSLESFFTRDNKTGIEKILEKNGIQIKNTLITDRNAQAIQIAFRQGPFVITNIVKYPYFIITDNLSKEHPITKDIYALTLPFVSPVEYSTQTLNITPLVKTSRYSLAKKENSYININPFQDYEFSKDDLKGPFTVSIIAEGKFKSSFDNIPKEVEKEVKEKKLKIEHIKEATKPTTLFLVTSSKFLINEDLNPENIQFFINSLAFLTYDEDIFTIRTKKAGFIPLKEIKDELKVIIKYFNIFFPIIIIITIGIYRWKKIEKEREMVKNILS